jgi:mxaJ protein
MLAYAMLFSAGPASAASPLRVCADPGDLPFSDAAGKGFENKIVALIAERLDRSLQFVWRAQRRGFLREGLNAGECDLVAAVPLGVEAVATTRPYYRSTYVFVTRPGEPVVASVDDKTLSLRLIGVQLIGDDGINSPPAHLLTWRGLIRNVRGYSVYGDEKDPASARRIVDAVGSREIDVAAVWGPVGGYFAAREKPPLVVTPMAQPEDAPVPIAFDIAMAVRRSDLELLRETNEALAALRPQILRILSEYNVPILDN